MRILSVLSLTILVLFFSLHTIFAQTDEFTYEKAYQDYVYMIDLYQNAHGEYLLAKAQYAQAQTLASQSKAQLATVNMLAARDDVVITYLRALRMRLVEEKSADAQTKNSLFARIDADIAWFENHKDTIPSAGTLDDLESDSQEAANKFMFTQRLTYETLGFIPYYKLKNTREDMTDVLSEVKNKIQDIRQKGDHDVAFAERWVLETENKLIRALDKEVEAQNLVFQIQTQSSQATGKSQYENVLKRLQEANQYLREANSYMVEIIKQIKTK